MKRDEPGRPRALVGPDHGVRGLPAVVLRYERRRHRGSPGYRREARLPAGSRRRDALDLSVLREPAARRGVRHLRFRGRGPRVRHDRGRAAARLRGACPRDARHRRHGPEPYLRRASLVSRVPARVGTTRSGIGTSGAKARNPAARRPRRTGAASSGRAGGSGTRRRRNGTGRRFCLSSRTSTTGTPRCARPCWASCENGSRSGSTGCGSTFLRALQGRGVPRQPIFAAPIAERRGAGWVFPIIRPRTLHHPDTRAFARTLRRVVDEFSDPPRFLVGEAFGQPSVLRGYCEGGDGLHAIFLFKAMQTDFTAQAFRALIEEFEREMPAPLVPTWVFGSHDRCRRATRRKGHPEEEKLCAALQLSGARHSLRVLRRGDRHARPRPAPSDSEGSGGPDVRVSPDFVVKKLLRETGMLPTATAAERRCIGHPRQTAASRRRTPSRGCLCIRARTSSMSRRRRGIRRRFSMLSQAAARAQGAAGAAFRVDHARGRGRAAGRGARVSARVGR